MIGGSLEERIEAEVRRTLEEDSKLIKNSSSKRLRDN